MRALTFFALAALMLSVMAFPTASAAPITTLTVSEPNSGISLIYVNQFTEFTLTVDPQGGPVPDMWYRWDGYDFTLYTEPFNTVALMGSTGGAPALPIDLEDGLHTLYYNATGETTRFADFWVDNTAPDTQVIFTGKYFSGDYIFIVSDTEVSFISTDADSGLADIRYSVNGGAEVAYTAPFKVPGTGLQNISYHSTDNLGNIEPAKQVTLFPDNDPPLVTISPSSPQYERGGTLYVATGTAIILIIDDMSGFSSANYSIDGGAWKPYFGGFYLLTEGPHTINAKATDKLGHESVVAALSVILDGTPPVVSAPDAADGSITLDYGDTVTLLATDSGSGDCAIRYSLDGGTNWFDYGSPIIAFNSMNITYTATDGLGNSATEVTLRVLVNNPDAGLSWRTYLGIALIIGGICVAIVSFVVLRRKGGAEKEMKKEKPRKKRAKEEPADETKSEKRKNKRKR